MKYGPRLTFNHRWDERWTDGFVRIHLSSHPYTESEIRELVSLAEAEVIRLINEVRTHRVGFTTLGVVVQVASRILKDKGFNVDTDWETFDDGTVEYGIHIVN